jgi:dTDP-4-amino-4,6-dideoxygalactose transaminase
VKHKFEFIHDEPGFNYRMPNLNAALGVAQFEKLSLFLQQKRKIAAAYEVFFAETDLTFVKEPSYGRSNYWLNTILAPDRKARDEIIETTNAAKVSTRPLWRLMHKLPMFDGALKGDLTNSEWLEDRIISLPSSAREIG